MIDWLIDWLIFMFANFFRSGFLFGSNLSLLLSIAQISVAYVYLIRSVLFFPNRRVALLIFLSNWLIDWFLFLAICFELASLPDQFFPYCCRSHRFLSPFINGFLCLLSLVAFYPVLCVLGPFIKVSLKLKWQKKPALGEPPNVSPGLGGKRWVGVPGCGKHGVWWKTRGLVENTGSKWKTWWNHYFAQQWSRNFAISNYNYNKSSLNVFFGHKSEISMSWETIAVVFFCMGRLFYISQLLA